MQYKIAGSQPDTPSHSVPQQDKPNDEKGGMVTLFTRHRRFGKTLALSMLRTFFELGYDHNKNPVDNSRYFEGKKIMNAPDRILSASARRAVSWEGMKSEKRLRYFQE